MIQTGYDVENGMEKVVVLVSIVYRAWCVMISQDSRHSSFSCAKRTQSRDDRAENPSIEVSLRKFRKMG